MEILLLGEMPCSVLISVTLKGLVVSVRHYVQLSELRVHLQAEGLSEVATNTELPRPPENAAVIPRTSCASTNLQVGAVPI